MLSNVSMLEVPETTSHSAACQKQRISSSYCCLCIPDLIINPVPVHATNGVTSTSLLMTCHILVVAPDGTADSGY